MIEVSWGTGALKSTFQVPVRVKAYDRSGLMRDISTLLAEEDVSMARAKVEVNRSNVAIFDMILEVLDVGHLSRVLDRLERLSNVFEARRVRPG